MKPTHYAIRIVPDFSKFTFSGLVTITIQVTTPVQRLTLNAHELEFQRCMLLLNGWEQDCAFRLIPNHQEILIDLPCTVTGTFILTLSYTGSINNKYAGLYCSKYTHNGKENYIASTQFEAKDARRAFPCFDQPAQKATFDIEYEIDASLTGISNTRIIEEKLLENGKKLVRFDRTPPMSTYLVFFGIGEFEFLEDDSEEPIIRVATTPGKTEYGKFALDIARKSLRFGAEYTGIAYPLSKCDYIAVPDSMGAMENFGAIRHCEDDLLVYPGITSRARSILTAKIVAHEAIHMWFGDLVSPAAWKFLWLNESFATYFTYVIPHHFYPEWGVWEQFFLERMLPGMERDSLAHTVPIDLPNVDDPDADPSPTPSTAPIVYNKGAAVLRMLAAYLGEERFKKAIHDFLKLFQFAAASSQQFWAAIEASSGEPITKFAAAWIYQPGYPLVTVEQNGHVLHLTQTRFTFDPQPDSVSKWIIPVDVLLFFEDGSRQTTQIILDEISATLRIPENVKAYKLNAGFSGFYRVCYPKDNWEKLGELIRAQTLSPIDSLNVLNDLFSLVKAGIYPADDYLRYVQAHLANETRYLPMIDLAKGLSHLYRVNKTKREEISYFGTTVFENVLQTIGLEPREDESLSTTELRAILLKASFLLGSHVVAEFGKTRFESILNGESVHRNILTPVLKIAAVTHPQARVWLTARAVDSNLSEGERISVLEALGNLNQPEALKDALKLNMEKIPRSFRHHMLAEAAFNQSALDWIWIWFSKNLAQIEELPSSYVQAIMVRLAQLSGMGRQQQVESTLSDFAVRHPGTSGSMTMALEFLAMNERLGTDE